MQIALETLKKIQVNSSVIASIAHTGTETLVVQFWTTSKTEGRHLSPLYIYQGVSYQIYLNFLTASSKGAFFSKNILKNFKGERLDN